jgi:hypothetical protein
MSQRRKAFITTFFLFIFLFPAITELVHAYEHQNEKYCTEGNNIHFHSTEHHCHICDFSKGPSDSFVVQINISGDVTYWPVSFPKLENLKVINHNFNFELRGPPVKA